jgi:hypothetical protein
VPTPSNRTWVDGLDNLGENLVRLSTALKGLEETPAAMASDATFAEATGSLAEAFALAFRQAHPVLVSTEDSFVLLTAESAPQTWAADVGEESPHQAGALVHEAILCSQEIVSLLVRIAQAGRLNAGLTRRLLQPALPKLADSASVIGWELKGICHEFQAEVKLLRTPPVTLKDLGAGARALARDMADAAGRLRTLRKDWFRTDHRLTAATGAAVDASIMGPVQPK